MRTLSSETRSAQHTAYGYFIFAAMAEASILPYTMLYLKHLGLSATHAGVIKSLQSFLSIWTLVFWVHFATRFNAHRAVIVSSVSVSIVGFLCATLLAPLNTSVYLVTCPYAPAPDVATNTTSVHNLLITEYGNEDNKVMNANLQTDPSKERSNFYYDDDSYENKERTIPIESRRHFGELEYSASKDQYDPTGYEDGVAYYDDERSFPFKRSSQPKNINKRSILDSIWNIFNDPTETTSTSTTQTSPPTYPKMAATRAIAATTTTAPVIYPDLDYDPPLDNTDVNPRPTRLSYLLLFITFMLGWIFGSPATTVADQTWYGYLDDLDLTEKYGNHNKYASFLAGLAALAASLAVALTNCRLWFAIDHFNIHFYMYAFFMLYALLFALCFPTVSSKFSLALPQTIKINEFRLLVSDFGLSLVTLTAILGAIFTACVDDFLLWTIEDLGGNELHFGAIVCLNFLLDIFAANTSRYLLRKVKLHLVLVFSLGAFALRLLLFSLLWNPWSAVTGQFVHFFSSTLAPTLMGAYLSRASDHGSYRALRTVVVPCLQLFGRAIGSCVFGIGYDFIGAAMTYQIAAGVGFVWCLVLLVAYRLKLSNSKRYVKLVHVQQIDSVMGDSETDEDWVDDGVNKSRISPTSA